MHISCFLLDLFFMQHKHVHSALSLIKYITTRKHSGNFSGRNFRKNESKTSQTKEVFLHGI